MGTSCNVMRLRIRSSPFVVQKWRKDEIDIYTPSPTNRKKYLQIGKYYSSKMIEKGNEALFLQLYDNAQIPD